MKGIVLTRFGEPSQVLELKTLPDPPPPGPGEVVVRVSKRSTHPGNLAMIRRRFNLKLPVGGLLPGDDGIGVVEAVGEGVDSARGVKPGARVIFNPSPGAWAERLETRADLVWPIQTYRMTHMPMLPFTPRGVAHQRGKIHAKSIQREPDGAAVSPRFTAGGHLRRIKRSTAACRCQAPKGGE